MQKLCLRMLKMKSNVIVLFHGFSTDKHDFDPIIPYLEKQYDDVICENLPGHDVKGLNGFTCVATMQYVDDLMHKLEKEYEQIDVMGFSMGGAIATYVASNFKVNKVVLLAPANIYLNALYPFVRAKKFAQYVSAVLDKRIKKKEDLAILDGRKEITVDDKEVAVVMKQYILPNYNIRTINQFVKVVRFCNEHLQEFDNPTLVVMGEVDQLVPKRSDEFLSKYCKQKVTITFKNISHMMLRSKGNKRIIDQVMKFLNQ